MIPFEDEMSLVGINSPLLCLYTHNIQLTKIIPHITLLNRIYLSLKCPLFPNEKKTKANAVISPKGLLTIESIS